MRIAKKMLLTFLLKQILKLQTLQNTNFCGRFVDTQLEKEFSYTEQEKYSNLKYAAALALGLMTAENIVAEENKPKTEISNQKDTNLSKLDSNNSVSNNKVEVVITAPMPKSHSIVVNGNFSIEYKPQIDSNSLKSIQKKEVGKSKKKK